jgi:hypothetical protein
VQQRKKLLLMVLSGAGLVIVCALCVLGYFLTSLGVLSLGFPEKEFAELEARYGKVIEELKAQAAADRKRQIDELAAARAAIPDGAPIPRDWDLRKTLANAWLSVEEDTLDDLLSYSGNEGQTGAISKKALGNLANRLGPLREVGRLTPFEAQFDPTSQSPEAVEEHFREYVLNAPFLTEMEAAIDLGVFWSDAPATADDQAESDALNRSRIALDLLACRIVALAQRNDASGALIALNRLCTLAESPRPDRSSVSDIWTLMSGPWTRRMLRPAVLLAEMGMLDADTKQRIVALAHASRDTKKLAAELRAMSFGKAEIGPILNYGKSDSRSEALLDYRRIEATDEFAALLEQPYYKVVDQVSALERKCTPEFWRDEGDEGEEDGKFREAVMFSKFALDLATGGDLGFEMMGHTGALTGFVQSYAREVLMGDIAVLAFGLSDHKHANGAYPEKLDVLVPSVIPAIPIVPWSGHPVTYNRTETGYIVTAPPRSKRNKEPVVVWRIGE